ncbi:MAG: hypothetical protein KKF56_01030, partial [Nanoarchaeota archaeon]|nr:hypothetical protein [Nanoarchaeota archaeon]
MNYKKFGIVMFEIINLVLLTFSFSFLVSLNLGVVVAEDINDLESNCCLEATNGAFCQEFVNTECAASCNGGCQPTSCSEVATCQLGCCQDGSEGTCGLNSLKGGCEEGGGNWFDSISCDNVAECDDGCCLLGNQAQFTTETRCARLSADMGVEVQYDAGITTEIGCLASAASLLEGACILPSGDCRYLTEQECYSSDSSIFYVGVLCSNPLINSTCERQSYTGCAEGMDEVFWFDSCGNRENVYSSDKDASWNNGNMLIKSESCGYGLTNINNPDCGNCNYLIGSRCENYAEAGGVQPTEGEYICKDMNCHNAPDNSGGVVEKSNGESWCVYDGSIGDGDDLVGSRHWKYVCVDGETESEPCSDFRNEICSQGGSDGFSQATCRTNKWSVCSSSNNEESEMVGYHDGEYEVVNYNEEENEIDEDTKMEDCDYKHIFLSSEMEFDLWLPKYAPGFDVVDNYGSAEEICAQANMECTVIYVKEMGSWECVANCECEEESFSQNMNEWCSSLGDCGFKMNIAGDEDAAYSVENTPAAASVQGSLDWEGNYVEPGDTGDLVGGAEGMVGVSGAWGEILLSYADENYEGVSSSPPDEEGGRGITGEVVGGGEGR